MVLKLFGSPGSTCTRRVALVCKELKIPYELIPISMADGEHKDAAFLKKQPFGQIPAIDDDGFQLFESRAICRYLAVKAGSPLLPKQADIQPWAKFEVAASIEQANFDPAASKLAAEKVFKPMRGGKTDENVVRELINTLNVKLDGYERILANQKYLAGDEISLADLFHLPYGWMLHDRLGYDFFKARPHVARWWKEVTSRQSWLDVKDGA